MTAGTRSRAMWRLLALLIVILTIAAACGDDDDDDDGGAADTTPATEGATDETVVTDETTAATEATEDTTADTEATDEGEPVAGGEATVLLFSEVGTLDPVRLTGSGGSDGQRAFPLYGGLVTYDPEAQVVEPLLLESIEPNEDFTVWTLTLPDGATFTDGTPFDAAAIQFNWTRAQDAANRSPAFTAMLNVASMEAAGQVLTVTLNTPNAQFDNSIGRIGALNSIGSPTFIGSASEEQLTNEAVGAGPYTLVEWVRDDHMTLAANPDWTASDGPYLETIELRPVGDEEQRVQTFLQGDAELMYTATPTSVEQGLAEEGVGYASVLVNSGQTILFNLEQAPLDDVRVRQAIAMGVDRQALADVAIEGILVADNLSADDSPWHVPGADLPEYDPEGAQALFDEYVAENGEINITFGGFQQVQNQVVTEFVQSQLNQFEGVNVEIDIADSPTAIGRVIAGDFQMHTWGFPWIDPDPGLYNGFKPGAITNYSRWSNPTVDAAIEAARQTDDPDERFAQYEIAQTEFGADLPYLPYSHPTNGFLYQPSIHGATVYEDGILRFDLIWMDA